MPTTIIANLTYTYLPGPVSPVGFQGSFSVYDPVAGGAGGQHFATVIIIHPANATYWTIDKEHSTGIVGANPRVPADAYDPNAISASWTGRISNNPAAPTVFLLRGKFNAPSGLIQIQAESTQLTNPSNSASQPPTPPNQPNVVSQSLPIPPQPYP